MKRWCKKEWRWYRKVWREWRKEWIWCCLQIENDYLEAKISINNNEIQFLLIKICKLGHETPLYQICYVQVDFFAPKRIYSARCWVWCRKEWRWCCYCPERQRRQLTPQMCREEKSSNSPSNLFSNSPWRRVTPNKPKKDII